MMKLALTGGTLIDGNGGEPLRNAIVVIEGSRITHVGARADFGSDFAEGDLRLGEAFDRRASPSLRVTSVRIAPALLYEVPSSQPLIA
jgi:hypothetical protein